jgi:ligand-binding SRPBCC domain-containing protein
MPVIKTTTIIDAPIGICFDLSRDIGIHQESVSRTGERAVAGRLSGLCESGDTVTWEAVHLGIRQRLSVVILNVQYPYFFEDKMLKGAFKGFHHQHKFREESGHTIMEDEFNYTSPLGWLGKLADYLFLEKYMRGFLLERNAYIKSKAETMSGLRAE